VTAPLTAATGRLRALRPLAIYDQVLLALAIAAAAAMLACGFVSVAPNRLVSGRSVSLWTAARPAYAVAIAAVVGLLLIASLLRPRRLVLALAAFLAGSWLLLLFAALGEAARALIAGAAPSVRVSAGAAFWIAGGCAALAVVNALQRLRAGLGLMAAVVVLICGTIAALAASGAFEALSITREYASRQALFSAALVRHAALVIGSVAPALAIGLPLGIAAARKPDLQEPVFAILNLLQTIPSIALFGLLIVPLSALARALPQLAAWGLGGIGPAPAVIALVLYALLPIARNTATGIAGVDPAVVEAARGMGLTTGQIFRQVELPLSLPVLLAGLRIVVVQTIGLAVVAALIGAGGLGTFVFEGLGQYALDLVLLGALPAIGLALAADFALRVIAALLPHPPA
jgi:osmoprotectant transport system permease protein